MTGFQTRTTPLRALHEAFIRGHIDRRMFVARATALGVGAGSAVALAQLAGAAQSASPAASPELAGVEMGSTQPSVGTEGQERGAGGELRVLTIQAASGLSVHNATGARQPARTSPRGRSSPRH